MNKEQVAQETHIYYQDENGIILTPLTMRASIHWGRGTRWCVSDKNEDRNTFDYYSTSGHLVFYITNEQTYVPYTEKYHQVKFCGHVKEKELLDIAVQPVTDTILPDSLQKLLLSSGRLLFFMEHGNILPSHFDAGTFSQQEINGFIKDGHCLSAFHAEDITEDNCITAINHISPWQIAIAPEHVKTRQTYISAARKNFQIIHTIDRNLPYFDDIRKAAFESYKQADDNSSHKETYSNWFKDLITQKETGRQRLPALQL